MGLDLSLLPIDHEEEGFAFSHSVLRCTRRPELFQELLKLGRGEMPEHFKTFLSRDGEYEDYHYGETPSSPYGERIEWVYAADLKQFSDYADVKDNPRNRAVWSFLQELPANTKLALYWS